MQISNFSSNVTKTIVQCSSKIATKTNLSRELRRLASRIINILKLNQFDPWKRVVSNQVSPIFEKSLFTISTQQPDRNNVPWDYFSSLHEKLLARRFSNFSFVLSVNEIRLSVGCYWETRKNVKTEKNWERRAMWKVICVLCAPSFDDLCVQFHVGCLKQVYCLSIALNPPFSFLPFFFTLRRRENTYTR